MSLPAVKNMLTGFPILEYPRLSSIRSDNRWISFCSPGRGVRPGACDSPLRVCQPGEHYDVKKIPLSGKLGEGKVAIVDDEDFERVSDYTWYLTQKGYVVHSLDPKTKLWLARFIMRATPGRLVDHRNHNLLDNRKSQLRLATKKENNRNQTVRSPRKPRCSSKFKGVFWHKRDQAWRAQIGVNRRRIWLGNFDTEREAAMAYNKAAARLHGEFCCLNSV
jgi:hypothetical protein